MKIFNRVLMQVSCKKISILFIMLLMISEPLHADVTKSPEMSASAYFNRAIERFSGTQGRPPRSWDELMSVKECVSDIKYIEGESNNYKIRYRFLNSSKQISIQAEPLRVGEPQTNARVIAMGIAAATPPVGHPYQNVYRNVILDYGGGEFRYKMIPEYKLKKDFEIAGADLSNYTGASGQWEPEPAEANPNPNTINSNDIKAGNGGKHSSLPGGTVVSAKSNKQKFQFALLIGCLIAVASASALIWRKCHRGRK